MHSRVKCNSFVISVHTQPPIWKLCQSFSFNLLVLHAGNATLPTFAAPNPLFSWSSSSSSFTSPSSEQTALSRGSSGNSFGHKNRIWSPLLFFLNEKFVQSTEQKTDYFIFFCLSWCCSLFDLICFHFHFPWHSMNV